MARWFVVCLCVFTIFGSGCSDDEPGSDTLISASSSQATSQSLSGSSSSSTSLSSTASSSTASLYISEYVEGSGNNKYVELYNPTPTALSLSGWSLRTYVNGAASPTATLLLSGSVPAGGTFVIRREPTGTWTGTADLTDSGDTLNFNGNDPVGLYSGSTLVDIVGIPGDASDHLKDMTLVRKPGMSATATWSLSDWYQHGPDTLSFLGAHDPDSNSAEPGSSAAALPVTYPLGTAGNQVYISEYFQGDGNDKYIEIFNNTSDTRVNLSSYRLVRIDIDNTTGTTNLANSWCLQLTGELEYYHTLVIVNGGFSASRLTTVATIPTATTMDAYPTYRKFVESASFYPKAICYFGGNDPVYLVKDGTVIDAVGTPATSVSWGDKRAFVRKSGKTGNPVWDMADWDIIDTMTPAPGSVYNDGSDENAGWHIP